MRSRTRPPALAVYLPWGPVRISYRPPAGAAHTVGGHAFDRRISKRGTRQPVPTTTRPTPRTRVAALLSSVLVAAGLLPVLAISPVAAAGDAFVSNANQHRADAGAPALALHATVDQIAAERGQQMAADRAMEHDLDYVVARLDQAGVCWERVGEIIAWNNSGDTDQFIGQWMDSPGHRDVMLRPDYTLSGAGKSRGGSRWYAAMLFVRGCGADGGAGGGTPVGGGFTDIAASLFRADITWLASRHITDGCTATRFCPNSAVTRGQMASFLSRALGLPAAGRDAFTDDGGSVHQADINRLAAAGVAAGCGGSRYCPNRAMTRAEMASFLARAFGLPRIPRDVFTDDGGSIHEGAINRVANAGIADGCAVRRYCPNAAVTRGQMAAFLHRALTR
jgi:uncharacterized protein YkwD